MRSRYKERSHKGYVTLSRLCTQPAWTHKHTVSLTLTLGSGRRFSGAAVTVPYTKHLKEHLLSHTNKCTNYVIYYLKSV
jgi:hypothetical protein